MKILIQNCISRDVDIAKKAETIGIEVVDLGDRPHIEVLANFEAEAGKALIPSPVFCSLQVGKAIRRSFPNLARGLDMPLEFLRHGHYSALLEPRFLLNGAGIYLPWSRIARSTDMLTQIFGPRIFLRPDSPAKPFTGFTTTIDELAFELSAREQTDHVRPEEMVFLAQARDLPEHEFRFWIMGSEIITSTSYSWDPGAGQLSPPPYVHDVARQIAKALEHHCQNFVADFVLLNGEPRLVELNAISTSGWYPGMDPAHLVAAMLRDYDWA